MTNYFQNLTIEPNSITEEKAQSLLKEIQESLDQKSIIRKIRSIFLIGGYGKGEGGILKDGDHEILHNNFDILLISKHHHDKEKVKRLAEQQLSTFQTAFFGIDVGVLSEWEIKHNAPRIMWYDAKYGHRHLLGDASFFRKQSHIKIKNIPLWDVINLLINRLTLLLINQHLANTNPSLYHQVASKHYHKAIIGLGDTLLFSHGKYHWSYQEKASRMQHLKLASKDFKEMYARSINNRFHPNSTSFESIDKIYRKEKPIIAQTYRSIIASFVHDPGLSWYNIPETLHSFYPHINPKTLLKKILKNQISPADLAASFTFLLFPEYCTFCRETNNQILKDKKNSLETYLQAWGYQHDPNYENTISRIHSS